MFGDAAIRANVCESNSALLPDNIDEFQKTSKWPVSCLA
jgi:hypothetical protein